MIQAVKERVTIQQGGRIEFSHPELLAGVEAEVIVMVKLPSRTVEVSADAAPPLPNYGEFLQAPEADEADQWGWEWTESDQDLLPRVLSGEADRET